MTTVNKIQIPVYRTRRSTVGRKSLPIEEKKELYEFKCDENKTGKRLKKTQRVRKRARICVRHKDTPPEKKVLKALENKENINILCHNLISNKETERKVLNVLGNKENIKTPCDSVRPKKQGLDNENIKTPCLDPVRHNANTPEKKILIAVENKEHIKTPQMFSPLSPNFSPLLVSPNITFANHCSTPVKDVYDLNISRTSSPDVSNCFGFSEEDTPEEFPVSPISFKDCRKTPPPVERPCVPNPNFKDVIRLLKFDVNESEEGEDIFTPSVEAYVDTLKEKSPLKAVTPETTHKLKHRRSYERPQYLWKANSSAEESEDEDLLKHKKVTNYKKKKAALSKKEEEELEKWAQAFNSQCDQVDAFNLCIE